MWGGVFCPLSVLQTGNDIPAGHQFYNHWHFKICQSGEGLSRSHNRCRLKAFIKAARQAEMRIFFGPDWPSDNITTPCLMFVTV